MEAVEESLESLVERTEQRERTVLRRTVLFSIIPVAAAVLLLAFISWQISQANQQLQQTNKQLATVTAALQSSQQQLETTHDNLATAQAQIQASRQELQSTTDQLTQAQKELSDARAEILRLQDEISETNQKLNDLQAQLQDATNLDKYRYTGDLTLALKHLAAEPKQSEMAFDIFLDSLGIPWKLSGNLAEAWPHRLPPPLQTIDQTVTGHFGGDLVQKQLIGCRQQDADRGQGCIWLKIVISRFGWHPALASARERTNRDRGFCIH